jgi:hypothetical protein
MRDCSYVRFNGGVRLSVMPELVIESEEGPDFPDLRPGNVTALRKVPCSAGAIYFDAKPAIPVFGKSNILEHGSGIKGVQARTSTPDLSKKSVSMETRVQCKASPISR